MKRYIPVFGLALAVIIIDQLVKLWVAHNMQLGEEIPIFDGWFKLHYTLNEGMAFGATFGGSYGKLLLTTFRIIAMGVIAYYLVHIVKKGMPRGLQLCVALILGGAVGNLIDSVFYGVWLNNAPLHAPMPWLYGQVVDMFYIDIWEGYVPEWMPLIGGDYMALWPIFNVADAAIFVGVAAILLFQKRFFKEDIHNQEQQQAAEQEQKA
ncbi:MAG: lipoprotein signal peptidase [Thermonema sp.]|uniref:lipoprotein signal peptidase n=1 Tax=Thermonema sp. TaxID=2231181 RepID=UPI0021DCC9EE|nr:lipoprotein signal peptidase [Thermonema sp.]GIV39458.1 MAG: lipoprotein signal peptidase [Thermonema sp.]